MLKKAKLRTCLADAGFSLLQHPQGDLRQETRPLLLGAELRQRLMRVAVVVVVMGQVAVVALQCL
jgi:hypothetical protein